MGNKSIINFNSIVGGNIYRNKVKNFGNFVLNSISIDFSKGGLGIYIEENPFIRFRERKRGNTLFKKDIYYFLSFLNYKLGKGIIKNLFKFRRPNYGYRVSSGGIYGVGRE